MEDDSRLALESLVIDNSDLERLEQLLGQFNIFEAIGAVRHELRHSDFLGFLLDPRSNHGLGDEFTRLLLQKSLSSAAEKQLPISLIDLDVWNLTEIEIYREWQNIDLLLVDNNHRLAVIIENKIGSSEHSNQLQRYRQSVEQQYPNWNVIAIFLTPDGDIPSDETYISLDYLTVCLILERLIEKRASTLGVDVRTLMTHYTQMLRRHIVSESEIAELCRRIYKKHKLALDLIFEHRPDEQAIIVDILKTLIDAEPILRIDDSSKRYIRFAPAEWYKSPLMQSEGWTSSGEILLFVFDNTPKQLSLGLHIGPGTIEIRQKLLDIALNNVPIFKPQSKILNQKWNSIYRKKFLQVKDYEELEGEELENKIVTAWKDFIHNDLQKINALVKQSDIFQLHNA